MVAQSTMWQPWQGIFSLYLEVFVLTNCKIVQHILNDDDLTGLGVHQVNIRKIKLHLITIIWILPDIMRVFLAVPILADISVRNFVPPNLVCSEYAG